MSENTRLPDDGETAPPPRETDNWLHDGDPAEQPDQTPEADLDEEA